MKFSFKNYPRPTGLASVGAKKSCKIRIGRTNKVCGHISEVSWDNYCIRFMVKRSPDKKDPCPFRWIQLKHIESTMESAKEWVHKNSEIIQSGYNLHTIED